MTEYFLSTPTTSVSYANADVRESLTDDVTLDSEGGATHNLTVTYTFIDQPHPYVQPSEFQNLVRVITPSASTRLAMTGPCTPVTAIQASHSVMACQLSLLRGASKTISFSWYVPSIVGAGPKSTYTLLVPRQAGATRATQITVTPAPGVTLSAQGGVGALVGKTFAWMQNPQMRDATLVLGVEP